MKISLIRLKIKLRIVLNQSHFLKLSLSELSVVQIWQTQQKVLIESMFVSKIKKIQ